MRLQKKLLFTYLILLLTSSLSAQYIEVDDDYTAQQLIENILINSPCAQVSNFSVSGWENTSNEKSYGFFERSNSNFPFENGVIITTGRAVSAIGPNNSLLSEGPTSWQGDSDLETAIGENNTINATVLEFDFLPLGNKMSFEYIFSSEQYLTNPGSHQCNYSDGFAFLLKEVGSMEPYENLAVVPNTSIPVKITTVRGSGTICPPANEQYFDAFNGTQHPTNYNGQTKILKAEATVTPGILYHLKLVVADQGNNLYDSAIFLGGGSFKVEIDLGIDRTFANGNPLCDGENLTLDATQAGNNTYQWFRNNIAIPGAVSPQYIVDEAGNYHIEVTLENTTCFATGEIIIEYASNPIPNQAQLTACDIDGNGTAFFNLRLLDNEIIDDNNEWTVSYYPSLNDAEMQTNLIQNPLNFESAGTTVYALVSNPYGCRDIVPIVLEISDAQIVIPPFDSFCDTFGDISDGIRQFNLDLEITPSIISVTGNGYTITYFENINDDSPLPNIFTNTSPFQQIIYAGISNGINCIDFIPVVLNIGGFGEEFEPQQVTICDNVGTQLSAPQGNYTYSWNTGETSRNIDIQSAGTYTVLITNNGGCSQSQTFTVTAIASPGTFTSLVSDFNGNNNTVTLIPEDNRMYLYSLDGIQFQESPVFINIAPGNYTTVIKNECGESYLDLIVLDYPRFFTPNNDGYNDVWKIKDFSDPRAKISIFDRYGKLLKEFSPAYSGWNGIYNEKLLPSDDYWFVLTFANGREIKGHFSLKR